MSTLRKMRVMVKVLLRLTSYTYNFDLRGESQRRVWKHHATK